MSAYLPLLEQITDKPKQFTFGSKYEANIARKCIDSAAERRGIRVYLSQRQKTVTAWRGEMSKVEVEL